MLIQSHVVRGQKAGKVAAAQEGVLAFALRRQRVEADQGLIDEARMAHHEAMLRQPVEELLHQAAEIGLPRKIVGAGKSGIESEVGARGAAAELRAQGIEQQRLGCAEPSDQRSVAAALPDPGRGGRVLDRRQKRVAYLRIELDVLVAVDEIRGTAEHLAEGCKLHLQLRLKDLGIEPAHKAGAPEFWKAREH